MSAGKERDIIRGLAAQLAEVAAQPLQQEKIAGWKRINGLKEHRPMLWITEVPWGEIEQKVDELRPLCQDERLRAVEAHLRRRLFTARHLPCDEVVEPIFRVQKKISDLDYGVTILERQIRQEGGTNIVSHHYEAVIAGMEDVEKIQMPQVACDEESTLREKDFLDGLLGDILEVRLFGPQQQFFPAWDTLVRWTGVTEALMALMDRPDFIHAIMRRMTDAMLSRMTQLEEQNLLDCPYPLDRVGSGGAGYSDELPQADHVPGHIRLIDQWGGATPQIFSEVSARMHEEFALNYELEVMARCGLNYYGCCEPLHNKMELMAKVPRLRKISVSPWCDVAKLVERARQTYVLSHKPSPAILAEDGFDAGRAEAEIRQRIELSQGMPCEIIMKDISTIRGDVKRLIKWCEVAYGVVRERE